MDAFSFTQANTDTDRQTDRQTPRQTPRHNEPVASAKFVSLSNLTIAANAAA